MTRGLRVCQAAQYVRQRSGCQACGGRRAQIFYRVNFALAQLIRNCPYPFVALIQHDQGFALVLGSSSF